VQASLPSLPSLISNAHAVLRWARDVYWKVHPPCRVAQTLKPFSAPKHFFAPTHARTQTQAASLQLTWESSRRAIDDATARVCDAAAAAGRASVADNCGEMRDAAAAEAKSLLHATAPNM
jgi:hypothetical protein